MSFSSSTRLMNPDGHILLNPYRNNMKVLPPPPEGEVGKGLQQRGFAFLLRLFILVLAQQSFSLVRQVVDPTAMLKTSSALAGFLLAPQVALAQAPSLPTASIDDGQTTLTWTNPSDNTIQSYKVRYRKRGGTWTEAAISGSDSTTTSHVVTGLENGYTYSLEICAVRAGTCSEYSTTAYVTPRTTSSSPPAKPTGLSATGGDRSVTLSWTASTDRSIRGYQYQQRSGGSLAPGLGRLILLPEPRVTRSRD